MVSVAQRTDHHEISSAAYSSAHSDNWDTSCSDVQKLGWRIRTLTGCSGNESAEPYASQARERRNSYTKTRPDRIAARRVFQPAPNEQALDNLL